MLPKNIDSGLMMILERMILVEKTSIGESFAKHHDLYISKIVYVCETLQPVRYDIPQL